MYVRGNPLKYRDPSGHIPLPLITGAAGAVIGAGLYLWNESKQDGFDPLSTGDWVDLALATSSGAVSGAMISTPLGVGMAAAQAGDHITNLVFGEHFSAAGHMLEGVTGRAAGFVGSGVARTAARSGTSIAKQRALGVGSAVLIEGPGEYVIDSVKGQGTSTSVVRGSVAAVVSKSVYEPLIERGAKGLSSNEATLWNTSFSTLFEVKKGMVGGTIEAFHSHYMQ